MTKGSWRTTSPAGRLVARLDDELVGPLRNPLSEAPTRRTRRPAESGAIGVAAASCSTPPSGDLNWKPATTLGSVPPGRAAPKTSYRQYRPPPPGRRDGPRAQAGDARPRAGAGSIRIGEDRRRDPELAGGRDLDALRHRPDRAGRRVSHDDPHLGHSAEAARTRGRRHEVGGHRRWSTRDRRLRGADLEGRPLPRGEERAGAHEHGHCDLRGGQPHGDHLPSRTGPRRRP